MWGPFIHWRKSYNWHPSQPPLRSPSATQGEFFGEERHQTPGSRAQKEEKLFATNRGINGSLLGKWQWQIRLWQS